MGKLLLLLRFHFSYGTERHADNHHRTLYLLFAAFPIVFQVHRGWSEGVGGLAFLGKLFIYIASGQALIAISRCRIWHVRCYRLFPLLAQMVHDGSSQEWRICSS